jgi:hypothetical protein
VRSVGLWAMSSMVEGEGDESHPAHTYFSKQVYIAGLET